MRSRTSSGMIIDTGPLIAALDRNDPRKNLAWDILSSARAKAMVPDPVVVEVDLLARRRFGPEPARTFLRQLRAGWHTRVPLSDSQWRRAIEIDQRYADFNLGFVDAAVMALAEARGEPVFTFDFRAFRGVPGPDEGQWPLVVTEADLYGA